MKILEALFKLVFYYFVSVGFVALGWNVCLTRIMNVPVFEFKEICLLTLALFFMKVPLKIKINITK